MHAVGIGWIAMVLTTLSAPADVFHEAEWLRDPVFEGVEVINLFHRERGKPPRPRGPKNVHSLFRKEVNLREKPETAHLAITGDDYYKFFLNGYAVVQGPEAGYPFAHNYYWLEVSEFLEAGKNCLAAHAYYQGLRNRVWNSADNRSGFLLCLEVRYADGSGQRFVTDSSWKCFQLGAFDTGDTVGYQTQFVENIDMRLMPVGWRLPVFDDNDWPSPLTGKQDHRFVLQITPPLQHSRKEPVQTESLGDGRFFYDFGTEIAGHTRLRITGPEGHVLTVRHGEELLEPKQVRYEMRASCTYEDQVILSGEEDIVEFYDYKAFRYMEILDAPGEPEVWVDVRHHPFPDGEYGLTSDEALLAGIWQLCSRGVQVGSQGGFLDCPTREKGQYLGDSVIAARSHLWLTGDPTLTKKALHDFALSRTIHPGLMAVAPGSFMQEIAEYSLQYPLLLKEYYRHTGDKAFLRQIADDVFPGLFGYFAEFENAAGLVEGMDKKNEKWVLVDWPDNLRDGYDYEYAETRANAVVNAFYYGALRTAGELERVLGRDGNAYDAKAVRVAKGFAEYLADPVTGLYLDAPGSTHSALHANAIPLFFGLTEGADPHRMVELIRQKGLSCGVYIASYVLEACFRNDAGGLAYDLITSDSEHSWNEMLKHGATTCMEAWGPDQKWNTSWCHPWSSSPIYLIGEYVMGLSPAEPGWGRIRIAPAHVPQLPAVTLTVPLPVGRITAVYTPGKGFRYTIPEGIPVEIEGSEGIPITVEHAASHRRPVLAEEALGHIEQQGWYAQVPEGLGVWVDVDTQMLYLLDNGVPVWQARCATAAAGTGSVTGSLQTPLGWHCVSKKFGDGKPWGQVFRSRKPVSTVWQPGDDSEEDLVLTRVLWLEGLEAGQNKGSNGNGQNVDSRERCIYIHGTNDEARIGTPSSHGCIRLRNDDVITAFEKIPEGTPVLISRSFPREPTMGS